MVQVLTHNQTHTSPQEALLHYGVKGMKWGVRKKDKPSGSTGPSKEEKQQQKRDVKVNDLRSRIAKTDVAIQELKAERDAIPAKGFRNNYKRNDLQVTIEQNMNYRNSLEKTAKAVEEGRMTPAQKRLLIGGALVGGAVLASYGMSKMQSGEFNSLKLRGQAALRGKPFEFDKNDAFAKARTPEDVLSGVVPGLNPNYRNPGGQMNCRRCSFTYELRRRGYNVDATASYMGWGQSESGLINALTPGGKNVSRATSLSSMVTSGAQGIRTKVVGDTRKNTADTRSVADARDRLSFLKAIDDQPAGARGEAVFNFGAFGHSLSYEKFADGRTYIFDTQKGKGYNVNSQKEYDSFLQKWGYDRVSNVELTRLDNVALDTKFLSRWATNSKGSTPAPAPTRPANMSKRNWNFLQQLNEIKEM